MSYDVSSFDDGHIIVMTLNSDFDIPTEFAPLFNRTFEMLEAGPDGVVVISDARDLQLKSFNDLLQGSNLTRSEPSVRVNKHRKLLKGYTVTNSSGIKLAAKGLNSASFGFMELTVFGSLDEAIEAARVVIKGAG